MKTPDIKQTKKIVTDQIKSSLKCISGAVVACGVGAIMGNVMRDYKPEAKGLRKMMIKIGAAALTGMVIKAATDYVNGEIDDIFEMGEEIAVNISIEKEEEDEADEHDKRINSEN